MYRKLNRGGDPPHGSSRNTITQPRSIMARDTPPRMSGRLVDIWTAFTIVTVPMLAFSAVLLGLVYKYRVTHSTTGQLERLRPPGATDEDGVYYVNLSATVLIFISSWSSSVGPLLLGFLMTLASYPLTRHYWREIQDQRPTLPTPYQFALSLKFLGGGGWGALYSWMRYLVRWKHQRQIQSRLLTESAFVTVIVTILGIVVFLADTWLHITTSTVSFVNTSPAAGTTNYSLTLVPGCLTTNNSMASRGTQCNLIQSSTGEFLFDPTQSLTVLNNVSDSIAVHSNGPDERYTYLGIPQSGGSSVTSHDYTATTFGMRTECKPASKACNLNHNSGASTPFRCTDAFAGDLEVDKWLESYFSDSTMASNDTSLGVKNPYHYAVAAEFQAAGNSKLSDSDEVITPVHGGLAFLLSCSIWMFDVEYDSINGTITRFVTTPSNDSVATIWQVPIWPTGVAASNLQTAALIAVSTATSAQDLADQYAVAYSKAALGVGAQSVQLSPAVAAQERSSLLVTRLPMAPLFCLLAANLAFVVLGIVLTCVALSTSSGGDGDVVRDVQARLSTAGLVADRFERGRAAAPAAGIEDLFKEHGGQADTVVAIERTAAGGFAYREWSKITDHI